MHRLSTTSSRSLRRAAAKAAKPALARGAHKEIKFSNEGRASILKGVDVLANAVQVTLGPKGMLKLLQLYSARFSRLLVASRSQRHHRTVIRWTKNHQGYASFLVSVLVYTLT